MMNEEMKKMIIAHKSGESVDLPAANESDEVNKNFDVYNRGGDYGSLENGLLSPNGESLIADNKPFTSGIIPGIDDIYLTKKDGIFYDFTIHVKGGCPKGKWSNKMVFQDESGDSYTLRIFSCEHKEHTVNYHSTKGNLVKITWDI